MSELLRTLITLPTPVLLLGLAGFLAWRWRHVSRGLFAVAMGGLLLACMPVTGKLLLLPLGTAVRSWMPDSDPSVQAVIVPTGGIYDDGTGSWWPDASSVWRLARALEISVQLEERGQSVPIIVSGGATLPDSPAEAWVLTERMDLPAKVQVWVEATALNSEQTARAILPMMHELNARHVVLVTGNHHMARMSALLRHEGIEALGVVAPVPKEQGFIASDLLPQPRGLDVTNRAIRNYAGIAWYLVSGGLALADLSPIRAGSADVTPE